MTRVALLLALALLATVAALADQSASKSPRASFTVVEATILDMQRAMAAGHTTDLPTTAGAMAFEHFVPPYEATLTKRLREAGAIIIAKTRLNEFAGWVTGGPTPAPNNYNAITRGTRPIAPRTSPWREPMASTP